MIKFEALQLTSPVPFNCRSRSGSSVHRCAFRLIRVRPPLRGPRLRKKRPGDRELDWPGHLFLDGVCIWDSSETVGVKIGGTSTVNQWPMVHQRLFARSIFSCGSRVDPCAALGLMVDDTVVVPCPQHVMCSRLSAPYLSPRRAGKTCNFESHQRLAFKPVWRKSGGHVTGVDITPSVSPQELAVRRWEMLTITADSNHPKWCISSTSRYLRLPTRPS
ncbi:hypothetical protein QBC32DRAFT_344933 [Pseudoneurospora amorphoporcata]|uniref:Uncharacterized protein n=1 Tax=Pseudoneurospora amorphoporcata TaxID=241081 RepID=A0AAN6NS62_9PEZI|nr:hypothetical protein QBC32DRAFT_344933 [Pseudoneurospora amorphoporcata]